MYFIYIHIERQGDRRRYREIETEKQSDRGRNSKYVLYNV